MFSSLDSRNSGMRDILIDERWIFEVVVLIFVGWVVVSSSSSELSSESLSDSTDFIMDLQKVPRNP